MNRPKTNNHVLLKGILMRIQVFKNTVESIMYKSLSSALFGGSRCMETIGPAAGTARGEPTPSQPRAYEAESLLYGFKRNNSIQQLNYGSLINNSQHGDIHHRRSCVRSCGR